MTPQELEVYDAMMADRDKWREKAEKQAAICYTWEDNCKPTEVKRLREAATYEHAGCTASAMGWAIKYANLHELALRLVQAKGRFHTQKAFEDLREFISSENA